MTISLRAINAVFQLSLILGAAYFFGRSDAPWFAYLTICVPAYYIGRGVEGLK
jgi:hypothetical protein